jgi:hypothetical protein
VRDLDFDVGKKPQHRESDVATGAHEVKPFSATREWRSVNPVVELIAPALQYCFRTGTPAGNAVWLSAPVARAPG